MRPWIRPLIMLALLSHFAAQPTRTRAELVCVGLPAQPSAGALDAPPTGDPLPGDAATGTGSGPDASDPNARVSLRLLKDTNPMGRADVADAMLPICTMGISPPSDPATTVGGGGINPLGPLPAVPDQLTDPGLAPLLASMPAVSLGRSADGPVGAPEPGTLTLVVAAVFSGGVPLLRRALRRRGTAVPDGWRV